MTVWRCDPSASFGERVVQIAVSTLAGGKLSDSSRVDVYRQFVACGGTEDLSRVRTSCAVFAGACLHWAGRPAFLPRYPASGVTSISSWLAGLDQRSQSWLPVERVDCVPVPGAIFYVESDVTPNNNHVGVLLAPLGSGVWATAEGGGGNGTQCAITWRCWGARFDQRRLRGLWLPSAMDRVGPPPPPSASSPQPLLPIVRGDPRASAVREWQQRLLRRNSNCLPRFGADGDFGAETVEATEALQRSAGLPVDGTRVDLATWKAAA